MADTSPAALPVQVEDLRMRYGQHDVLQGVSFRIERGEVVALLGPNGAGKTTTIEILEGFRAPSAGTVRVLGADPGSGDDRWRARLGVVLQSWRDHNRWRVRELLDNLRDFYDPDTPNGRRPYGTDELLDMVGLTSQARQRISSLSGGQRRRLDVAVGIVGRPELLFLDEPTAGFDPVARHEFHELVHRLSDTEETTVLLTTHDLAEAEKLADRILILCGGTIMAQGSADQLARRIAGQAEVRWRQQGVRQVHSTTDPTAFVRSLFATERPGEPIDQLEVLNPTLETTYLTMIAEFEAGRSGPDTPGRPTLTLAGGAR
jgi:ABC-2 type transport system ATP-binding protein